MKRLVYFEDYFVKMHKKFGICALNFTNNEVDLESKYLHNMVFRSEDFNSEYENLKKHCIMLFEKLKRSFSLRIRKDWNNNYYVEVL